MHEFSGVVRARKLAGQGQAGEWVDSGAGMFSMCR
jgi:hypothetical protein